MTRTFTLLTLKLCEQIKRVVVGYSLMWQGRMHELCYEGFDVVIFLLKPHAIIQPKQCILLSSQEILSRKIFHPREYTFTYTFVLFVVFLYLSIMKQIHMFLCGLEIIYRIRLSRGVS